MTGLGAKPRLVPLWFFFGNERTDRIEAKPLEFYSQMWYETDLLADKMPVNWSVKPYLYQYA